MRGNPLTLCLTAVVWLLFHCFGTCAVGFVYVKYEARLMFITFNMQWIELLDHNACNYFFIRQLALEDSKRPRDFQSKQRTRLQHMGGIIALSLSMWRSSRKPVIIHFRRLWFDLSKNWTTAHRSSGRHSTRPPMVNSVATDRSLNRVYDYWPPHTDGELTDRQLTLMLDVSWLGPVESTRSDWNFHEHC